MFTHGRPAPMATALGRVGGGGGRVGSRRRQLLVPVAADAPFWNVGRVDV
jgi:hypothetical protein